jgi:hypothetical protein
VVFNTPLAALSKKGKPVLYTPPPRRQSVGEFATVFGEDSRNPLGLYEWKEDVLDALFALYAPRIWVDESGGDDRIGELEYDAESRLWVNIFRPVVYRRLGHTFTAQSSFDMLAGQYDGLIWRVTVGTNGQPLVYDTIHPCGCYHLFFPTESLRARPQPESLDEPLFSPQALPTIRAGESLVLHLEAQTHYLQRVTHDGPAQQTHVYEFARDDDLRSLRLPAPEPGGPVRRSAFGPDGIMPGSERGERFLFWPMGIDNAGAMRQWGRHATAFVGMRHFDDPDLFEKYFEIRQ